MGNRTTSSCFHEDLRRRVRDMWKQTDECVDVEKVWNRTSRKWRLDRELAPDGNVRRCKDNEHHTPYLLIRSIDSNVLNALIQHDRRSNKCITEPCGEFSFSVNRMSSPIFQLAVSPVIRLPTQTPSTRVSLSTGYPLRRCLYGSLSPWGDTLGQCFMERCLREARRWVVVSMGRGTVAYSRDQLSLCPRLE